MHIHVGALMRQFYTFVVYICGQTLQVGEITAKRVFKKTAWCWLRLINGTFVLVLRAVWCDCCCLCVVWMSAESSYLTIKCICISFIKLWHSC